MMEDIVGDYADKTVTLEDFPFYSAGVKMASVHPCKHASVMKSLLDRADAALKIRLMKIKRGGGGGGGGGGNGNGGKVESGMEGLVDELGKAQIAERRGQAAAGGDEWEVLNEGGVEEDEVAIRVDQYLVVFLKVRCLPLFFLLFFLYGTSPFPPLPLPLLPFFECPSPRSFDILDTDPPTVHGQRYPGHRARFHDGRLRRES